MKEDRFPLISSATDRCSTYKLSEIKLTTDKVLAFATYVLLQIYSYEEHELCRKYLK